MVRDGFNGRSPKDLPSVECVVCMISEAFMYYIPLYPAQCQAYFILVATLIYWLMFNLLDPRLLPPALVISVLFLTPVSVDG